MSDCSGKNVFIMRQNAPYTMLESQVLDSLLTTLMILES
jgi:hypothetical protein